MPRPTRPAPPGPRSGPGPAAGRRLDGRAGRRPAHGANRRRSAAAAAVALAGLWLSAAGLGAGLGGGLGAGLGAGLAVALAAGPAAAQSGLPIPRFVTLGTDEANLRTGPGRRYPVEWVFVRRGMPVEVIAEFDTWRRIRDWEGVEGWVHQSLLSGRRGLIVTGADLASLWSEPRDGAALVARVEPGVVGRIRRCPPPDAPHRDWCWVELSGLRGWMTRDRIWGVYDGEAVD